MPIVKKAQAKAATGQTLDAEVILTSRPRRRIVPVAAATASWPAPGQSPDSANAAPRRKRYVISENEIIASGTATPAQVSAEPPAAGAPKPKQRRGHARKGANGKWQPTGDKGFCSPPPEHRFKPGNPGGPGRPKKEQIAFDDLFTKHALRKMRVGIDGQPQRMAQIEAFIMRIQNDALAGKSAQAQKLMTEELKRLFPAKSGTDQASAQVRQRMDDLVLRQFFAGLAMGEPSPEGFDPLAEALQDPPRPGSQEDPAWDEGDWDADGEDNDDDDRNGDLGDEEGGWEDE